MGNNIKLNLNDDLHDQLVQEPISHVATKKRKSPPSSEPGFLDSDNNKNKVTDHLNEEPSYFRLMGVDIKIYRKTMNNLKEDERKDLIIIDDEEETNKTIYNNGIIAGPSTSSINIDQEVPKRRHRDTNYPSHIPLPQNILDAIKQSGGTDPIYLASKRIYEADVRTQENRLNIPQSEKLWEFLSKPEQGQAKDMNKKGLEVEAKNVSGSNYRLRLRRRPSLNIVVLNHGWNSFSASNGLEKDDLVELWGYRSSSTSEGKFCLVINVRKDAF